MPESAGPGDLLCGVDIGTTSIKAVLVTWDGSVVSVAKAPTPVLSDGYGPCHDPEEIRATAEQVMGQALRESTVPGWIAAIGVTSVGEEGVPLGPGGELLYPSIAWYDRRPSEAEEKWSAQHADEEMFAVTGLHKDLGFTIYKWLWLKSAQPSVWSRCRSWLGIADYVIWRWTGQQGMSVSHASRTGIFELRAFRWQQDWAAAVLAGGADVLPPLREAGSPVGFLRPGAIPGLATTGEIPVVATGLDHAVGAYAAGVTHPGQVLDSMGTAEGSCPGRISPSRVLNLVPGSPGYCRRWGQRRSRSSSSSSRRPPGSPRARTGSCTCRRGCGAGPGEPCSGTRSAMTRRTCTAAWSRAGRWQPSMRCRRWGRGTDCGTWCASGAAACQPCALA